MPCPEARIDLATRFTLCGAAWNLIVILLLMPSSAGAQNACISH